MRKSIFRVTSLALLLTAVLCGTSFASLSVLDAGAVGDGKKDDTAAFRKALAGSVSVTIPFTKEGYRITGTLDMSDHAVTADPGTTIIFSNKTPMTPAILFDGTKSNYDAVKFHGSLEGLSIRLESPYTVGVKMLKTRRVTLRSVAVFSTMPFGGTVGVLMDGPGEGLANNTLADIYASRLSVGIMMDTSSGDVAWCNRNQVQGFIQSCNIGVDMRSASTNTLNVATQDCETGIRMGSQSRQNMVQLISENDKTALYLEDAAANNVFSGTIPSVLGKGLKNIFANIEELTREKEPTLDITRLKNGNYIVSQKMKSPGNTVLTARGEDGRSVPVLTITGGDDPTAVFGKDIKIGGRWDGPHLRLGPVHIWVDRRGNLRYKTGAPTYENDGKRL